MSKDITLFDEIAEQEFKNIGGGLPDYKNSILFAPGTNDFVLMRKALAAAGYEIK